MRKYILSIAAIAAAGCSSAGQDSFELACKSSGGSYLGNMICACDKTCGAGVLCKDGKCGNADNPFKYACEYSKGIYNEATGNCSCNEQVCGNATICIDNGAKCGEPPMCSGNAQKCENNKDGLGVIAQCDPVSGSFSTETTLCPNNNSCNASNDDCGECKNGDLRSCVNSGEMVGSLTERCINGKWQEAEVICPNNTSCKDANTCGECNNNSIQCVDTSSYKTCANGVWQNNSEQCPGNAQCKPGDSHYCDTKGLEDCFNPKCTEQSDGGYIQQCIRSKLTETTLCLDDDGAAISCLDDSKCGYCLNNSKRCTNDPIDNNYIVEEECRDAVWHQIDRVNDRSCVDDHIGDCKNGYYNINIKYSGLLPSDADIRTCTNGSWQIDTNNFNSIIKCENKIISFYSDYTWDANIVISEDDPFKCSDLLAYNATVSTYAKLQPMKGGFGLFVNSNGAPAFEVLDNGNIGFINYLLHHYTGSYLSTVDCNQYRWFCKEESERTNLKWFDCDVANASPEESCKKIKFCVDSLVADNEFGNKLSYVITMDSSEVHDSENNNKAKIEFIPAPNGCNSNRTDQAYDYTNKDDCSQYALGMTARYQSNDTKPTSFNICRYGHVRHVECNNLFKLNKFTCTFSADDDETWENNVSTACIDFIDEFNNQQSYLFYPSDMDHMSNVIGRTNFTTNDPYTQSEILQRNTIRRCIYGCNADRTNCAE